MPWTESGCEGVLTPVSSFTRQSFAGFVSLPTGSELFLRIERPLIRLKGWYLLVHGLMDSHRAYEAVTRELIEDGYGVIRIDLRGFGLSLAREIQQHQQSGIEYQAKSFHDYKEHVRDLKALLVRLHEEFGIQTPHLVGHSMGGGLVMALLADPLTQKWVAPQATVIAPYVYRLEYYLIEKFAFQMFPVQHAFEAYDMWVPQILRMGQEYVADMLLTNHQMRLAFMDFFDQMTHLRGIQIAPEKLWNLRSQHVDTAISMVKGLRNLNSMVMADQIPKAIRVDLVYGRKDEVVEKGQARKLGFSLERRGGKMFELEAGHNLLEEKPAEIVAILTNKNNN